MSKGALSIVIIYGVIGFLWIYFSDWLVLQILGPENFAELTKIQNVKGALFIFLTATILFLLIKRYQESYTKEHQKYTFFFEKNPNAICLYNDRHLEVIASNLKFQTLFGQIPGKAITDLFIDQKEKNAAGEILKGPNQEAEQKWQLKSTDNQILHCLCSKIPIEDGQNLLIIEDITKELEYENQLRELNEELEKLVDKRTRELTESNLELAALNGDLQAINERLADANRKITEQNRVIQKQGEEQLNRILANLKNVAWIGTWPDGEVTYLSKSAENIYGLTPVQLLSRPNFWHHQVIQEDSKPVEERMLELKQKGFSEWSYRISTPEGHIIWLLDRLTLEYDEQGDPFRINGLLSDITPIKEAELQIREYTQKVDSILNSITDGFFTVNQNWIITRINKVFEVVIQINAKDVLGRSLWDVFPMAVESRFYSEYNRALKEKITVRFQEYYEPLKKWFNCTAYTSSDGLSVFFRDITHEKEIQQNLLHAKRNLDSLINNTDDIIWSIDREKKLISANTSFKRRTAKIFGRILSKGDSVMMGNPDSAEYKKWEQLYNRALRGEKYTYTDIIEHHEHFEVAEISFNPILDDGHQVISVGCFTRDITSRKKYEQERSELINRLMAQNQDLEEFAFVTSHKIRAPIVTILGLINLIKISDPASMDIQTYLENLKITAGNLDETIHELSMILQLRDNHAEVKEENTLENLLKEAIRPLEKIIADEKIDIKYDFNQLNKIYSIPSFIQNILYQLISNSIKYRNANQSSEIRISSFQNYKHWGFLVSDNGIGFPADYKTKLFKLYHRFHNHTQGKGLGLFMVKLLVDNLNGRIDIDTTESKGTVVKVTF